MKAVVQTFNFDSSMDLGKAQWWETPLLLLGGPGSQRGAKPSGAGVSETPCYHVGCEHGTPLLPAARKPAQTPLGIVG